MIKIIIIALFAGALVLFAMRFFPETFFKTQKLLQNLYKRAKLADRLWRQPRAMLLRHLCKLIDA